MTTPQQDTRNLHPNTWMLRNTHKRTHSTLRSRAPPALLWPSLSSEDGVYSLSPGLLAALIRHPTPGLRHLPQGGAVKLTRDRKPGQPLELAAEGGNVCVMFILTRHFGFFSHVHNIQLIHLKLTGYHLLIYSLLIIWPASQPSCKFRKI